MSLKNIDLIGIEMCSINGRFIIVVFHFYSMINLDFKIFSYCVVQYICELISIIEKCREDMSKVLSLSY
jgi:hypothetical protein